MESLLKMPSSQQAGMLARESATVQHISGLPSVQWVNQQCRAGRYANFTFLAGWALLADTLLFSQKKFVTSPPYSMYFEVRKYPV